jgi:uncharacterized protein (DUF934 family)
VLALAGQLRAGDVIALHFPKWTDGRAYSQARLLRSRLGFAGALWATGEVVVDMLPLLQRSGFSNAQLRAGQDRDAAERALGFFDGHYQADLLSKLPAFASEVQQASARPQ